MSDQPPIDAVIPVDLNPAVPPAKQAVLVIHGMGEQRPMDTIKGFVQAVWESDTVITKNGLPHESRVWSKPDARAGSLELRRITTRQTIKSPPEFPGGVRTDFYELYWADLTAGTPLKTFIAWFWHLLVRPLSRVPPNVRSAWFLLWFVTLLVVLAAILTRVPDRVWDESFMRWLPRWTFLIVIGFFGAVLHTLATQYFGRVARYTRADPDNVAARQAVRERGLKLLRELHAGSGYSRIIIVSHSLGTMLAHDLLSYFWAEREGARTIQEGTTDFDALCDLERAAGRLLDHPDNQKVQSDYAQAQRKLRRRLQARTIAAETPIEQDPRWLISDFVTLGSPLTHAEFLIATSQEDLEKRKIERELPTSPPFREELDPAVLRRAIETKKLPIAVPPPRTLLLSFPAPGKEGRWELHHAAPFAVVRWINVFDPAKWIFFGDIIGGPVQPAFGPGVLDVDLRRLRRDKRSGFFTHTKYWTLSDENAHIKALRVAVNLLDRPDADPNRMCVVER
jgi:hypothetical protein